MFNDALSQHSCSDLQLVNLIVGGRLWLGRIIKTEGVSLPAFLTVTLSFDYTFDLSQ